MKNIISTFTSKNFLEGINEGLSLGFIPGSLYKQYKKTNKNSSVLLTLIFIGELERISFYSYLGYKYLESIKPIIPIVRGG